MDPGHSSPGDGVRSLFAVAIRRPVGVTMIVLGVVIFGIVAYTRLELALLPRFSHPTLTVRTPFPGSAPEEVEQFITIPVEKQLSIVSGLVQIRSLSRAGLSEVVLEFQWDTPLQNASLEVREKLDRLVLPEEAEPPQLLRFAPEDEPIMRLALVAARGEVEPAAGHTGEGEPRANPMEERLSRLHQWAEESLKPPLVSLPGVAAVSLRGGADPEVVVELDEGRLARLGLSVAQVAGRLEAEHVNLPGGVLAEGPLEYRVRTLNELETLEAISDVLISPPRQAPVRLRDVAEIRIQPGEAKVLARMDGRPAIELEVFKEADANVVDVAGRVRDKVWGASAESEGEAGEPSALVGRSNDGSLVDLLAAGESIRLVYDQSRFIRAALAEVRKTALMGGLLAIGVLVLFLGRLRATLFVLVALPVSILATFLPMFLGGVTLNLISMGGLALGVGMLVDNSIVVLEAIHRLRDAGRPAFEAALEGVREVGGAVSASTFTTAAVFFPMVFVEGVAGQIIGDLALTVVFSLIASLVVAVWVLPMLTVALDTPTLAGTGGPHDPAGAPPRSEPWRRRRWLAETNRLTGGEPWRVALAFPYRLLRWLVLTAALALGWVLVLVVVVPRRGMRQLGGWSGRIAAPLGRGLRAFRTYLERGVSRYRMALRWALHRPLVVLGLSGLTLIVAVLGAAGLPQTLMPPMHQGVLRVDLELPTGRSLETTAGRAAILEQRMRALPRVRGTFARVGEDPEDPSPELGGPNQASLWVTLDTGTDPALVEADTTAGIWALLGEEPEMAATVEPPQLLSIRSPLTVEIQGEDLAHLDAVAGVVAERLKNHPALPGLKLWEQSGSPEVQIRFDRERLAHYGLSARAVAERVRAKLEGETPVRYRVQGKEVDVRVRVRRPQLDSLEELASLVVNPGQAVAIPLEAVAEVREGRGPAEIRRIAQRRTALITADVGPGGLKEAREVLNDAVSTMWSGAGAVDNGAILPGGNTDLSGLSVHLGGQGGELAQSLNSLALALGLAVFLVYLVLASQFESFLAPFVILVSVPLAGIGVVGGLWMAGEGLSVLVGLGLIVLVGIVVNNAIVLVATVLRLAREGRPAMEAIVEAGAIRLRPILMTTLTTVLGLLPMVAAGGEGAELRAPIALTLISGLTTSMLLTLLVIPVACRLLLPQVPASPGEEPGERPPLGMD